MHPFFDASKLSDDELSQKVIDLSRRLYYAQNMIGDAQMIDQLRMLIETLEFERTERYQRMAFEEMQKMFPKIIESDPEFKENGKEQDRAEDKPGGKRKHGLGQGGQPVLTKGSPTRPSGEPGAQVGVRKDEPSR